MSKPNVLVIGGGGREHAIVDALRRGGNVDLIYCYPGNGGISQIAHIPESSTSKSPLRAYDLLGFACCFDVGLTIVGPEAWLVDGIADQFAKAGKLLLGPTKAAAQLEGSKIFAKQFMKRHGIPTASFDTFYTPVGVRSLAAKRSWQCVIKADGLCGGKGVYVCHDIYDVDNAIDELFTNHVHGKAGGCGVVEDLLEGIETSFFVLTDSMNFVEFGTAGDHKRAFDGDKGPNTGGMGAFAPCPFVTEEIRKRVLGEIVEPTISRMAMEGAPFQGFLYVGIMLTTDGPKVLEYNVRLGDPEAQVILPLLESDAFELFQAATLGELGSNKPSWSRGVTVGVNLVSGQYPTKETIREKITGPIRTSKAGPNARVYHGATVSEAGDFFATGGRILTVVGRGPNYLLAQLKAYRTAEKINFDGMRHRNDIGKRAIVVQAT